eukprot:m.179682 g.179682  ORF g.179682 m.179682 type:complete len:501 (-) comp31987_c0_seq1:254-1756(-)
MAISRFFIVLYVGVCFALGANAEGPAITAVGDSVSVLAPSGDVNFSTTCDESVRSTSVCQLLRIINELTVNQTIANDRLAKQSEEIAELAGAVAKLQALNTDEKLQDVADDLEQHEADISVELGGLIQKFNNVSKAVANIYNCSKQGLLHGDEGCVSPVPICLQAPDHPNADAIVGVSDTHYYPVNSVLRYKCKPGYFMKDPEASTGVSVSSTTQCIDQQWTAITPCEAPLGKSCREVYAKNNSALSGPTMLSATPYTILAYCDMVTPGVGGVRGFTLCSKYYRDHPEGPRYLNQGFGRENVNANDMSTLSQFTGKQRWSSIDCRAIIRGGADYFMHAATNEPVTLESDMTSNSWGKLLFTTLLADVKKDPTNLFDLTKEDTGTCTPGVMSTFNPDGTRVANFKGYVMQDRCLIGTSHHFCDYGRDGSAFNNMRGTPTAGGETTDSAACSGSQSDTIFWAWLDDGHFCDPNVIGTGCKFNSRSNGPAGLPRFAYNYMLVY